MGESCSSPRISVIVPTYNRAHELSGLVRALQQQSLPPVDYEVLLVDDGSSDGTRDYLDGLGGNFRLLRQPHGGASRARNLAARHARGTILAFTDDDCRPDPNWLEIIGRQMEAHGPRAALLGRTFSEHAAGTFIHSVFKTGEPVVTCNFAVPREAFELVGGFDEHFILYFEDEDLGLRLKKSGYPIVYVPGMRVLHPSRYQDFRTFLRRRNGLRYLSYMSQKHPDGNHWQRHRGVVSQIVRKALLFGLPLLGAGFWLPLLLLVPGLLLAHFVVDGLRGLRLRQEMLQAGFSLRLADQAAFTLFSWAIPFVDGYQVVKGMICDRGRVGPWRPPTHAPASAVAGPPWEAAPREPAWSRRCRMLWNDPALLVRKGWRRAILRLPHQPMQTVSIGEVRIELDLRDENMRSMFLEWYEVEEVALLKRLLAPGQTVLDIGANIGYLTAAAAAAVGPRGAVHAFEPVPACYQRLLRLAELNPGYRIVPVNLAAGERAGQLQISLSNEGNIGWNTLVPGLMPERQLLRQIQVPVRPLDEYIAEAGLPQVHFIKLDAEGYEFPILRGLRGCLERHRPVVLCEVVPAAYPLLQSRLEELETFLRSLGYRLCDLHGRSLPARSLSRTTNVLLLPEGLPNA